MMSKFSILILLVMCGLPVLAENPSRGDESKSSALLKHDSMITAIAKGDHEEVALRLDSGENANEQNSSGWTPLHYAAVRNEIKCAEVLLEKGAQVDLQTKSGKTALHFCAERNYKDLAVLLIKNDASLVVREKDGWAPLHYAAARNRMEVADLLLRKGAEVNAVSTGGGTPLHEAAAGSSWQMIDLLLQKGADKSIKAKNGKTALDYAIELDNEEARDLLSLNIWFHVGEQLVHRIYWGFIPVGKSITSSKWIEKDDKRVIALTIRTRTNKVFDQIRPVNDVVESIVDPKTFLPLSFARKMIRRRNQCDEETVFNHKEMTATWSAKCSNQTKTFNITKDTRDILTFTYFMRDKGFSEQTITNYRVMADNGIFDLGIKTSNVQEVKLPVFENINSLSVEPSFDFDGLLVDKGKFKLWISQDKRHIMTRSVIKGKLADIRVILCKVLGPGDDFWTNKMKEKGESLDPIAFEEIERNLLE